VFGIVIGIMILLTACIWFIQKKSQHDSNNNHRDDMLISHAEGVAGANASTVTGGGTGGGVVGMDIEKGRITVVEPNSRSTAVATAARKNERFDDETQMGNQSLTSCAPDAKDEISYAYSLDAGGGTSMAGTRASAADESTTLESGQHVLPVATRKGSLRPVDYHVHSSQATMDAASIMAQRSITRQVVAPPGKLGLVLDTIRGQGPVVHKINSSSPLKGSIFEGDVVIAINGIDTRHMNAEELTNVMVQTTRAQRTLTVESEYYR
jgi:PDZ domain